MSSPQLRRRLEAAEDRHGMSPAAVAVIHRPDGLSGTDLAAWNLTDDKPDAALVIVIRCLTVAWPPRDADDVRANLGRMGLHKSPEELAMRIRSLPDYPEKTAALACLPTITLQ